MTSKYFGSALVTSSPCREVTRMFLSVCLRARVCYTHRRSVACAALCSAPPSTTHRDVVTGCRCGGLVYNTAKCLGRGPLSRSVITGRAM